MEIKPPAPVNRVYQGSWFFRCFSVLFLCIALCVDAFLAQKLANRESIELAFWLVAIFFPIVGGLFTITAFTGSVSFTQDAVRVRSFFEDRTLALEAIRGRRIEISRDKYGTTRTMVLIPIDDRFEKLEIEDNYNFDHDFRTWFEGLRDLDAEPQKKPEGSNFGLV